MDANMPEQQKKRLEKRDQSIKGFKKKDQKEKEGKFIKSYGKINNNGGKRETKRKLGKSENL